MVGICEGFSEFGEVDEYYREVWKIEKFLGYGNYSEV